MSNIINNYSINLSTQDGNEMVFLPGSKVQIIFQLELEI